jgi:putative salt-induced outer membrane protein
MPWSAVKSVRSDTELNVVLPAGQTARGKLSTTGDQLQIAAGPETKTAPLAAVATVRDAAEQHAFERLEHPGILELWSGNFDVGLALANGNARSEALTTAFTAGRRTRGGNLALYFNQIYSTARVDQQTIATDGTVRVNRVNATIASAVRGGWKYNRNVSPRMFLTGFNDYEHDRFQNLDIRFVAGGGAGVRALKTENAQLDFDAGIDYQRENFLDGLHRNSAEANFGDNLLYKVLKGTSINQALRVFTNLSDTGAYRMNFDLGTTTLLKRWLGWHVTASDRFLSNPVQGRQRNDLLISTGFRLTFAR